MKILLNLTSLSYFILLIISGCTPVVNTQNLTASSADKCTDKPEAALDAKKVKTINLGREKITESGMVSQDKSVGYVFLAQAGKKLVYHTIQDVCIAVFTPDNQLLNSGVLPITGNYTVQIFIPRGSTTFDLAMNLETESTASVPSPAVTPIAVNTPLVTTSSSIPENNKPSTISSFTSNNISRPSPTKVIKDYFAKINNRQYADAWDILPVELQENKELHPNGYNSFLEWYRDTVDFIDIHKMYLAKSNNDYATVKLQSTYYMKSGRKSRVNLNFYMVWNENKEKWDMQKTKVVIP